MWNHWKSVDQMKQVCGPLRWNKMFAYLIAWEPIYPDACSNCRIRPQLHRNAIYSSSPSHIINRSPLCDLVRAHLRVWIVTVCWKQILNIYIFDTKTKNLKINHFRGVIKDINLILGLISEVYRTFKVFFLLVKDNTFLLLYDHLIPQNMLLSH